MRLRLAIAHLLALALLGAVVLLIGSSGGPGGEAAAAPGECLAAWNGDDHALTEGRHARTFHLYDDAQVGYLSREAGEATVSVDAGSGPCVVVFPRRDLDPEITYAGFTEQDGRWTPLSSVVEQAKVAAMQGAALDAVNAKLTERGELVPP